ncbi:MAG: ABC transporter permease subunit [Ignisphaera sp.]
MTYEYGLKILVTRTTFPIWLGILISLLLFSFVYTRTIPSNPGRWYYVPSRLPPSLEYPLGTTMLGQNMLYIVPEALKNSITISAIGGFVGILIALMLATVAVLPRNNIIRSAFAYFIDVMCMIPGFPILMIVLYAWRAVLTLPLIGVIFGLIGWTFTARSIRGLLESLKTRLFIQLSYFSGASLLDVLVKDIVPYILRYLMVGFINIMLWSIGQETFLSLFGAMKLEIVTIGTTIYWALQYQALFLGCWWWIVFPILFLVVFVVALYKVVMWIDTYVFVRRTMV